MMLQTDVESANQAPGRLCAPALRLAVLRDYREEAWPSMDLCAEMLLAETEKLADVTAVGVCPPYRRRFGAVPFLGGRGWARNGDRLLNRHWDFPRHVRALRNDYGAFHICDHSYGQLAHMLPGERTGVFCHDVDTFRSLVEPDRERRPAWFRWMMRRVLQGMKKAAVVFHTTNAVRNDILKWNLVAEEKLVKAPLGYAVEFSAEPRADAAAERILAPLADRPFLLHVGSCIPRKRVDFLLWVFASLRSRFRELGLVKVGGSWSAEQRQLIDRHGLGAALHHVQGIERSTLAVLYRKAQLMMLPSESEGFGLPLLEGLACGTPVLASDLPVLREVGGSGALYAPPLDLAAWCDAAAAVLTNPSTAPSVAVRLAQAGKFSWREHASIILDAYRRIGG